MLFWLLWRAWSTWRRRHAPPRYVCHVERLPPVPVYQLRLLRVGQAWGAPYPAVATLLAHADHYEIIGLHADGGWRAAHHAAVSAGLWRAGLRGDIAWDRMKRIRGVYRPVRIRKTLRPP